MNLLEVKNISKVFKPKSFFSREEESTTAVENVTFSLARGNCLGLVGESGCGKSTLGRIILGLAEPDTGEVYFQEKSLYKTTSRERYQLYKDLQVVFQDYQSSVNPGHKVKQIVGEPISNFLNLKSAQKRKKIQELLDIVGLPVEDIDKYPRQFSGGQLQRICIARAIALKPELIILDEPVSSLDLSVQAQILNLLLDLKKEFSLSYIFISHDLEVVSYIADSLMVMYLGRIVESIKDISDFNQLKHPYSNKLLSSLLAPHPDESKSLDASFDEPSSSHQDSYGCNYAQRCEKVMPICMNQSPTLRSLNENHYIACHYLA